MRCPRNSAQLAQHSLAGIRRSAALNAARDAGCTPNPCSNKVTASPQQDTPDRLGPAPAAVSGVISRQSMYRFPASTMPHGQYGLAPSQMLRTWSREPRFAPLNTPAGISQPRARHVSNIALSFTAHPTPSP